MHISPLPLCRYAGYIVSVSRMIMGNIVLPCKIVLLTLVTPWCEGISPLGYWQKVNQSPTQTKPYNTLPPFEPRDSWSSYGAVRAYSEVLYILWGPRESDLSGS